MKKIYTMLGQQKINTCFYGNEDHTLYNNFDKKVKFPVTVYLSTILKDEETCTVVAIDSFGTESSAENRLFLEEELHSFYGERVQFEYLNADFSYSQKGQIETFKIIYNSFKPKDEVYFDITFGLKPTPMTVFVACNYVNKFMKDVKIKRLFYAHFDFNNPEQVHPIIDVTSLFLLNSMIDTLSMMESENPMSFIDQVFDL